MDNDKESAEEKLKLSTILLVILIVLIVIAFACYRYWNSQDYSVKNLGNSSPTITISPT